MMGTNFYVPVSFGDNQVSEKGYFHSVVSSQKSRVKLWFTCGVEKSTKLKAYVTKRG